MSHVHVTQAWYKWSEVRRLARPCTSEAGRKWYKEPKVQGSAEELLAIERELDALEHM